MLNEIGPRTENFCKSKIEWKDPNERIWIGDRYYTEEQYKERRAYRRNLVDSEPRLFVRNKFSKQKSKAKLVRNLEWALDIDEVTEAILSNSYRLESIWTLNHCKWIHAQLIFSMWCIVVLLCPQHQTQYL